MQVVTHDSLYELDHLDQLSAGHRHFEHEIFEIWSIRIVGNRFRRNFCRVKREKDQLEVGVAGES